MPTARLSKLISISSETIEQYTLDPPAVERHKANRMKVKFNFAKKPGVRTSRHGGVIGAPATASRSSAVGGCTPFVGIDA